MLRTALKPRWLGLFVVLVLVLVSFFWLGLWQLDVARDKGREEVVAAAAGAVVPIAEALGPHAPFPAGGAGRRVQATGRYAADGQFLVAPRRLDGRDGAWVVTPLVVESTGATLAVVRGFVPESAVVPAPPGGPVTVTASLAPGSRPPRLRRRAVAGRCTGPGLDRPRRARQRVAGRPLQRVRLRGRGAGRRWGRSPGERPGAGPAPVIGETGLSWRNAAYALQWWIFAAFAAYMWFRMVRDDHQLDLQREESHV